MPAMGDPRLPAIAGAALRADLKARRLTPFIGIFDVYSATLAGRQFRHLFLSGFGLAASHYGLPDIGLIAWPDVVDLVRRIRTVLPQHHLLVDIDDGYGDAESACHVVSELERAGASGVVLEDQKRPRKCGHLDGKQSIDCEEYVAKLRRVLKTRRELFVIARTDVAEPDERRRRVEAYASAGADALLVDGLSDLQSLRHLRDLANRPFAFNQIAGGKSPRVGWAQMEQHGVSIAIYSTPCLFAAHGAMEQALSTLAREGGTLPADGIDLGACNAVLQANLARRDAGNEE